MRRGTHIAKQLIAADAPAEELNYAEVPAEDMDSDQLEDLVLDLIGKVVSAKSRIKKRGAMPIRKWMPLNSSSTVKDCLVALSMIS